MCELTVEGFDIAATAGWYSAIAGLLAGFAMLAILLPLDHETRERGAGAERAGANGVVVFTNAFFALLVLTFTYAILAGRPEGPVAAHEQQLGGAAFGVASLLMLVGLREVLRLYGGNRGMLEPANALIGRVTGILGPLMLVAFAFSNALDVEANRRDLPPGPGECIAGLPSGVWINAGICGIAAIVICLVPVLSRGAHADSSAAAMIGHATLGFTVLVAVWTAVVVPLLPLTIVASPVLEHAIVAITAAGAVAFGAAAWLSRRTSAASET